MLKSKVLLTLGLLVLSGISKADDQINQEVRKNSKTVKTLSVVKDGQEHVYAVPEAYSKRLPQGEQKNLNADQKNQLEEIISEVTKVEPIRVVPVNKDKEEATTARWRLRNNCWWGGSVIYNVPYFYNPPVCYYPNYYVGGGFYYNNGFVTSARVWSYYGAYQYNNFGGCYWGY